MINNVIENLTDRVRMALLQEASIVGKMRYFFLDRHYSLTIRVLLVLLCMGVTLTSTFLLRESSLTGNFIKGLIPVVAMIGIAVVLFVYSNFELTAVMIFIVTLTVADGVGTGTGTKITLTFMGLNLWAALWLFKLVIVDRKIAVRPSVSNVPTMIFLAIVLISFIWSNIFVDVPVSYIFQEKFFQRTMTMVSLVIAPITAIMYANHIRSIRTIKIMVYYMIFCGFVFGAMRIAMGYVINPLNIKGLFPMWVGALALGQLLFNTNLKWYIRVAMAAVVGMWYYIQLGLGLSWLSGWIPLSIVIVIIVTIYSRKLLLVAILVAAAYVLINLSSLQENFAREDEESGGTRNAAWSEALAHADDHLFLGSGPAGYYFYYTIYGFRANLSHNNYIDIIAQTGLVGFTAYILMWLAFGRMNLRMYWLVPNDNGFLHGLKISLIACWVATMVAMMLGDWVTPFPYTQGLNGIDYAIWAWIFQGMAVALCHLMQRQATVDQLPEIGPKRFDIRLPSLASGRRQSTQPASD
ncbi:MAG: O-antigen ligase family protein [Anaerolineae bacterium]|nr:O-antigen ligase family protein [Anaerolineae bacterium]